MKKHLLNIAFICLASVGGFAQDAIEQFFSGYSQDESFTKVNISGKMFQLFAHIEGETQEEKDLLEAISKIERLKIITATDIVDGKQKYTQAVKVPTADYEVLMTVEDEDEDVTVYIKESEGIISELLMIAGGIDNLVIMSLTGDIDLNQIARISRAMDIEGLEYLEKVED